MRDLLGYALAFVPTIGCGVGTVAAVIAGFLWISSQGAKLQARIAAQEAAARPAEAEILGVRTAPLQDSNRRRTALWVRLRVRPRDGEPYEAVGAWAIDAARTHELAEGRVVPVKIAADDPQVVFSRLSGVTWEPGNHQIRLHDEADRRGRRT